MFSQMILFKSGSIKDHKGSHQLFCKIQEDICCAL